MLILKPQVRIITKEVALATGEMVRAYFAVVDINGVIDIRFLGTKPVAKTTEEKPLLLACPTQCKSVSTQIISSFEKVSHYFTLDFLVNQLARAPSVN